MKIKKEDVNNKNLCLHSPFSDLAFGWSVIIMIMNNLADQSINVGLNFLQSYGLTIKNGIIADAADHFQNCKNHDFRIFETVAGCLNEVLIHRISTDIILCCGSGQYIFKHPPA